MKFHNSKNTKSKISRPNDDFDKAISVVFDTWMIVNMALAPIRYYEQTKFKQSELKC